MVTPVPSSGATGQGGVIHSKVLEKERENDFEFNRVRRFKYRTRYFTDSGIIGSKEFVMRIYNDVKPFFPPKRERVPKSIEGLAVYIL